jgi:hypothetical protein
MDGNEMTDEPTPAEAELAKLADGSLPDEREADLRAEVGASPGLAAALAEQERAVALLRSVDERAPDSLRAQVDALTGGASARRRRDGAHRRRLRRALVLPAASALAVVIAAIVILAGGTGAAPTVPQAAHVALSSAMTLPRPAVDSANPSRLRISADGIPFSNWPGWSPLGARTDVIGGRRITTVFYRAPDGARVGYAIVSGSPLQGSELRGGYAVSYTLGYHGSARLVTWVRDGHTCVIAGRSVPYQTLLGLARSSGGDST